MHGLRAAEEIVESVLTSIQGKPGRVKSVYVEVGPDSTIDAQELELCFEVASRGTAIEGTRIDIRLKPGTVECLDCGYIEETIYLGHLPHCSSCSGVNIQVNGEGIILTDVVLEDE